MARRRFPAAERKRQIAQAALTLLGRRGARGLTAAELARAVGVTDATLFRHFASMEEIVDAAIALVEAELTPAPPDLEQEPLEELGHFVVARIAQWQRRPELRPRKARW